MQRYLIRVVCPEKLFSNQLNEGFASFYRSIMSNILSLGITPNPVIFCAAILAIAFSSNVQCIKMVSFL